MESRLRKKKSPDQSHSAGKAPDAFLDMASLLLHDLEGPIASMRSIIRLLENNRYDSSKELHQRLVASTKMALQRAETILQDLMAAAKAEHVGLPVEIEEFDITPLLNETILMASAFAAENDISIVVEKQPEEFIVSADRDLVSRVTDNLLFNAVRHTPSGGTIRVNVSPTKGNLVISIMDGGDGFGDIDPEMLFTKYEQIKLRKERRHRGVGLGLYFCRLATEAFGGKVWAENAPEGGGRFLFTVPAGG